MPLFEFLLAFGLFLLHLLIKLVSLVPGCSRCALGFAAEPLWVHVRRLIPATRIVGVLRVCLLLLLLVFALARVVVRIVRATVSPVEVLPGVAVTFLFRHFSHLIILLLFLFIRQNLVCIVDLFEFVLVHSASSIWVILVT